MVILAVPGAIAKRELYFPLTKKFVDSSFALVFSICAASTFLQRQGGFHMVGGVALSVGRGAFPASRGPVDSPAFDTARVEVVEFVNILEAAANSIWAVECGWPDVWARRLDCFALELDDPCRQDLLDEERFACRHADHPFVIPEAECAGEVDQDIVQVILSDRRLREDLSLLEGHNDLMVELINLQRSRW